MRGILTNFFRKAFYPFASFCTPRWGGGARAYVGDLTFHVNFPSNAPLSGYKYLSNIPTCGLPYATFTHCDLYVRSNRPTLGPKKTIKFPTVGWENKVKYPTYSRVFMTLYIADPDWKVCTAQRIYPLRDFQAKFMRPRNREENLPRPRNCEKNSAWPRSLREIFLDTL